MPNYFSPSPPSDGGEGRGEEARFYREYPSPRSSPHSFLAGRGRNNVGVLPSPPPLAKRSPNPHDPRSIDLAFPGTPVLKTQIRSRVANLAESSAPRCGGRNTAAQDAPTQT